MKELEEILQDLRLTEEHFRKSPVVHRVVRAIQDGANKDELIGQLIMMHIDLQDELIKTITSLPHPGFLVVKEQA